MRMDLLISDDTDNYLITPNKVENLHRLESKFNKQKLYLIKMYMDEYVTLLEFKKKENRDKEYHRIREELKG